MHHSKDSTSLLLECCKRLLDLRNATGSLTQQNIDKQQYSAGMGYQCHVSYHPSFLKDYIAFLLPISRLSSAAALNAINPPPNSRKRGHTSTEWSWVLGYSSPITQTSFQAEGFIPPRPVFHYRFPYSFLHLYRSLVSIPQIPPISELRHR